MASEERIKGEREEKIEKLNAAAPANESVNSTVSSHAGCVCEDY